MNYTKQQIAALEKVTQLKLINAVTGIKPANLIGTVNSKGETNLAIFSSIVHLGTNPPLLGFITKPSSLEVGHTLNNIVENTCYTINHIHPAFAENAHFTSTKFSENISEFKACNLSEEYLHNFKAPFVKQSNLKIAMRFKEKIDIKLNGTILVIGEIEHIILPDSAIENDDINLASSNSVGISGLNTYYSFKKIANYPYASLKNLPQF